MYGFSTQLNIPFDTAVTKVTEALKNEGLGVPSCLYRAWCQLWR